MWLPTGLLDWARLLADGVTETGLLDGVWLLLKEVWLTEEARLFDVECAVDCLDASCSSGGGARDE